MRRLLLRCLAAVLLAGACLLAPAPVLAQPAGGDPEGKAKPNPALEYLLAVGFTLTVLVIVCKPSRKA